MDALGVAGDEPIGGFAGLRGQAPQPGSDDFRKSVDSQEFRSLIDAMAAADTSTKAGRVDILGAALKGDCLVAVRALLLNEKSLGRRPSRR